MDTVLILSGGRRVNALLLSASTDRLRVVIPGHGDTDEFHLVGSGWQSETGVPMEIGALMQVEGVSAFAPQTQVRAFTA